MTLLEQGIAQGIVTLTEDKKRIHYPHCNKNYLYGNEDSEERVRAAAYVELVLHYGYPVHRLDVERIVPGRTTEARADIVVFEDDERKQPYIVVECKAPAASEAEFVQAVEQGFSYAVTLNSQFVWITSNLKSKAFTVRGFATYERDKNLIAAVPRFGYEQPARAKYYKGAIDEHGEPAFDLQEVKQEDLTRIFKKAHQALWGGGKRNPSEAFDELDKLIFCKLWDERKPYTRGQPYRFQEYSGEAPSVLETRIKEIYKEGEAFDKNVFGDPLRLTSAELKTVVGYLAKLNIGDSDLDSKGRAFETFLGSFFRGDFGQYFTPRPIVEFIVDVLPITNKSKVLDTSCGSGGFLLYALNKVRHAADDLVKDGAFKKDSAKHYSYWHDFASKNLFGIEISESIARTAKMNMIIHDDGHTNVVTSDGLLDIATIREQTRNDGFAPDSFDIIITNPPFGSVVKQTERAYLRNYALGKKDVDWVTQYEKDNFKLGTRDTQSTEALFLEQCWRFLKPGTGWLAIVVPDGLLTNASTQYVRDWVEEHYRIVSVVSLPQEAFRSTDAGVKSSVLFLRKLTALETEQIQTAKREVRGRLWRKGEYAARLHRLDEDRKKALKSWTGFDPSIIDWNSEANLEASQGAEAPTPPYKAEARKLIEKSAEFKTWKAAMSADFTEQANELKEELREQAQDDLRDALRNTDYRVLMAIPTDIGFDGTGRETPRNDIKVRDRKKPEDADGPLTTQLKEFITATDAGKGSFFA
jgi:type I restriction enzyme M protein